jgi:hypothetical protein
LTGDSFFDDAEHLFNLKFTSKQLQRESKRCEKKEKQNKLKLKHVCTQPMSHRTVLTLTLCGRLRGAGH